jgi:hypothetical protein
LENPHSPPNEVIGSYFLADSGLCANKPWMGSEKTDVGAAPGAYQWVPPMAPHLKPWDPVEQGSMQSTEHTVRRVFHFRWVLMNSTDSVFGMGHKQSAMHPALCTMHMADSGLESNICQKCEGKKVKRGFSTRIKIHLSPQYLHLLHAFHKRHCTLFSGESTCPAVRELIT